MQGFINHCRLAHQRDFQTHDHAAAACGAPFDSTGYDGPMPPPRSTKASKYHKSVQPTLPKASRPNPNTKAAPKADKKKTSPAVVTAVVEEATNTLQTGPLTPPLQAEDITLQKTIQTSHLKKYLSKKQVDVENLDTMVEEAVNRVGMVEESEGEEDDGDEAGKKDQVGIGAGISERQPETGPKQIDGQDAPAETIDVDMMDFQVNTDTGNSKEASLSVNTRLAVESTAIDSAYGGSETIADTLDASNPIQMFTPDNKISDKEGEEQEQQRPTSRRSNAGLHQSPRTPVAPNPVRMGTRAHPSPESKNPTTRHSARLTGATKASPGKRT
ncbi:hypothetical protein ABW20_dc0107468 [Dactylellina cionopaga]|nr:hypothetical protein ABW20_dc0107468 [Dactylellina cionopaga]